MFCQNCGTELNDKAKFCGKCGAKMINAEPIAKAEETAEVNLSTETAANVTEKTTETQRAQYVPVEGLDNFFVTEPKTVAAELATQLQPTETSEPAHYVSDGGLDQFFKTNGRLNRLRYFKRVLVLFAIGFILSALIGYLFDQDSVGYIIGLLSLWPGYCLDVRRLQDMGKGISLASYNATLGAMIYIIPLISDPVAMFLETNDLRFLDSPDASPWAGVCISSSIIACILALYLLFKEGTKGANQYGPDPIEGKH